MFGGVHGGARGKTQRLWDPLELGFNRNHGSSWQQQKEERSGCEGRVYRWKCIGFCTGWEISNPYPTHEDPHYPPTKISMGSYPTYAGVSMDIQTHGVNITLVGFELCKRRLESISRWVGMIDQSGRLSETMHHKSSAEMLSWQEQKLKGATYMAHN